MAELDAQAAMLDEAEEEELWLLTLARQARHIQVRCACTPTYKICHRLRILLPLRPRTPVAPCPHPLPHLPSPSPCPPPAATH